MRRPFEILAVGAVLGELIAFAGISFVAAFAMSAVLFVCFYFCANQRQMKKVRLFLFALLLFFTRLSWERNPQKEELFLDSVCGVKSEYMWDVHDIKARDRGKEFVCGKVIVTAPDSALSSCPVQIGDKICVRGKLSRIEGPRNPGEFDFSAYYRAKGITHRFYAKEILASHRRRRTAADLMRTCRYHFREFVSELFRESCMESDAGFLGAALFGIKEELPDALYERYQRNGIAHLLAISGLHVGLLGLSLYRALRKTGLDLIRSGVASGGILLFYMVLTGSGTGVCRAVCMLLVSFLASAKGRNYDLRSAASASALILLMISPLALFQCGFQLSFLAVIALGGPAKEIVKEMEKRYGKKNHKNRRILQFFGALISSAIVFLVTMPVLAYWFFVIPPYSVFLNVLVIPLMGYVLWAGIAILIFRSIPLVLPFLSVSVFQYPTDVSIGIVHRLLQFYDICCRISEQLPGHRILIGRPKYWQIAVYYIFLLILYHMLSQTKTGESLRKKRHRNVSCILIFASALLVMRPIHERTPLVWFLDVGQGDGIVIEYGDSCVTIDGGSTSKPQNGKYILKPFLESRGIGHIETAFITHADVDHTNGILYLLKEVPEIRIDEVTLTAAAEGEETHYSALKEAAGRRKAELSYFGAGEERGCFTCLWPERGTHQENVNEHSLVMLFSFGNRRCLFTGDAGISSEASILERLKQDLWTEEKLRNIDLLKVGHHGSRNSGSEAFLSLLHPDTAVISCGRDNRYGHPHPETVARLFKEGAKIRNTEKEGAIRFPMR